MAVDLKKILVAAATAAATQAAIDPNTSTKPDDVAVIAKQTEKVVAHDPDVKAAQHELNVKTNNEPFYLSIQWWTAFLGLVGTVAGFVGYSFPAEMQKEVLAIITGLIGVGSAALMFYNRYIRFRST